MTRALSEDFAGLREDLYDTNEIVAGSPDATHIYIREQVADAIVVRTQTIKYLRENRVKIVVPPSEIYEDNEIVVKISDADGAMQ